MVNDAQRDRVAAEVAAQHGLTARELEILRALLDGVPRRFLHRAIGVSENTIKTQVRCLLERLDQPNTDHLLWWCRARAGERVALADITRWASAVP